MPLEREAAPYLRPAWQLVLDLNGVQNIDEEGLALLGRWSGEGVRLRGGSLFVRTLMESYGLGLE